MTRRHLTLIHGGLSGAQSERAAVYAIYPAHRRVVRAEPKPHPRPVPPTTRPAA